MTTIYKAYLNNKEIWFPGPPSQPTENNKET